MKKQLNFLVLYRTKFRKISSYDALEMMERYTQIREEM